MVRYKTVRARCSSAHSKSLAEVRTAYRTSSMQYARNLILSHAGSHTRSMPENKPPRTTRAKHRTYLMQIHTQHTTQDISLANPHATYNTRHISCKSIRNIQHSRQNPLSTNNHRIASSACPISLACPSHRSTSGLLLHCTRERAPTTRPRLAPPSAFAGLQHPEPTTWLRNILRCQVMVWTSS